MKIAPLIDDGRIPVCAPGVNCETVIRWSMDPPPAKPRLVFFQYRYDEHLPAFLLIHKHEHVKCLSQFFDVIVIQKDCDYRQICDTYHPDLTLFESGVNHETCQRLKIENTRAHPGIPKIGLHHADSFCNARAGFLSDMDHWGIHTFFAISTTAAEHTPEIADNLFYWPVFIDPTLFKDYGAWKIAPVLFTGNMSSFYPWRQRIFRLVSKHYPSLSCPHTGYSPEQSGPHILIGEQYARTINASWCAPTCGTVANEAVRKHFEVPACRTCLVTEKSAALEAAGFVDMKNCVFADEHDILDKLAWLFDNPNALKSIIDAGYELVHSRHTLNHRDQIYQWFRMHKAVKPGQLIIQANPFEAPFLVQESSGRKSSHVVSNGLHLAFLREGDEKLWGGRVEEAEASYRKCINYMRWMPEPKLRMALCSLYKGDAKSALTWIEEPMQFVLVKYRAMDPDPVEWAYFIISLLCLGKLNTAIDRAGQFGWLRHPELERARWASEYLKKRGCPEPLPSDHVENRRYSIHRLPERGFKEWKEQLCVMLRACGQSEMADTLGKCLSTAMESFPRGLGNAEFAGEHVQQSETSGSEPGKGNLAYFRMQLFIREQKLTFRQFVSHILHSLEARFGYFLPYHLSGMRNDEFLRIILDLTNNEKIHTALVIGASCGEGTTEALLAGARRNQNNPHVFCIGGSDRGFQRRKKNVSGVRVKWYSFSASFQEKIARELENKVGKIKEDNHIEQFNLVLIDGSVFTGQLVDDGVLMNELRKAELIFIDDTNLPTSFNAKDALLRDSAYMLIADNPSWREGYSIFRRVFTYSECGHSTEVLPT